MSSSRTITDPTSSTTIENSDYPPNGVAHIRLNRAIEIVIDSIQSLEGAVNNFDQLVFGLIYGQLSTRTELESIEVKTIVPFSITKKHLSSGYDSFISNIKFKFSITLNSRRN